VVPVLSKEENRPSVLVGNVKRKNIGTEQKWRKIYIGKSA
jgi:hypothetical protein